MRLSTPVILGGLGLGLFAWTWYQRAEAAAGLRTKVVGATPASVQVRFSNLTNGAITIDGLEGQIFLNGREVSDFFQAFTPPFIIQPMAESVLEIKPRNNALAIGVEITKLISTGQKANMAVRGRVKVFGRNVPLNLDFVPQLI